MSGKREIFALLRWWVLRIWTGAVCRAGWVEWGGMGQLTF